MEKKHMKYGGQYLKNTKVKKGDTFRTVAIKTDKAFEGIKDSNDWAELVVLLKTDDTMTIIKNDLVDSNGDEFVPIYVTDISGTPVQMLDITGAMVGENPIIIQETIVSTSLTEVFMPSLGKVSPFGSPMVSLMGPTNYFATANYITLENQSGAVPQMKTTPLVIEHILYLKFKK